MTDGAMTSSSMTGDAYLELCRQVIPQVEAAADEINRTRELPLELANAIADRGLFRLLVPRAIGGVEMDFLQYLAIIQTFGEADGSTAWCVNQNNVFATHSAIMPRETAQEIWREQRAVVANGPPSPAQAAVCDGGYQLTGRWNFSSGCRHAGWLAALTPMGKDGADRNGDEDLRLMLFKKEEATLVDVWDVNGLRGTGSFSFEVSGLFVPKSRTFRPTDPPWASGPLYVLPISLKFASGFACVALGVARAGLKVAVELAGRKTPRGDQSVLSRSSAVQRQIGQAEAIWSSARAFLLEAAGSAWDSACREGSLSVEQRIRLRLAATNAIRMSADVVDIAYNICGADAIFGSNPIQRRFQDIHVITQQVQGRMAHYETAGQFYLGLEPEGLLY